MNKFCISYLHRQNWRMKSQVLCISMLMSMLIVLAIYIVGNMFFKIAQETFVEASQSMFDQQTTKQLHIYLDRLEKQTIRTFQRSQQTIQSINGIYQLVQQGQISNSLSPLRALDDPNDNDTYAYTQSFTYMFGNSSAELDSTKNQQLRNLTAILTETLPIMNPQGFIYFTDGNDEEYFSVVKGDGLVGYHPHNRPWYKDHVKQMYESQYKTLYSNPYLAGVDIVFIALTQNLTFLNNSFGGVIALDVGLQSLPKISEKGTTFMVVNETGYMIICQYYIYGNRNIRTIYNQSITGLTIQDWFLIKELGDFNRQLDYIEIQNTTSQQIYYVTCVKLEYPNYYLIALTEKSQFEFDQHQIQMKLQSFIDDFYLYFVVSIFVCLIVVILIQLVIIRLLLSPINNLKYQAQSQLNLKKQIKSQNTQAKTSRKSTLLSKLYQSYNKLLSILGKCKGRNRTLILLQNIEYPIQFPNFDLNITFNKLQNGMILSIQKSLVFPRLIRNSDLKIQQIQQSEDKEYIIVGNNNDCN